MEVHHHPDTHHRKKKFKEYFLEFIMIFLAVLMGFIAENIREKISDREKEKEYIQSLIQDLKKDTSRVSRTLGPISGQINGLDTLEILLTPDVNKHDSVVHRCYLLSRYLLNEFSVNFSDRTIIQLFNSGNMRLLKKQSISDSIVDYYSGIKNIENQKTFYLDHMNKCVDLYHNIFDFSSFQTTISKDEQILYPKIAYGNLKIMTTNADDLRKYNSTIEFTKLITYSYRAGLISLNKKAESLLVFLQNEYHLDDE